VAGLRLPMKDILGLTEYQLISLMQGIFPFIVLNIYLYSESVFVDIDLQLSQFVATSVRSNQVHKTAPYRAYICQ
jgi:hypothetical protein